MRQNAAVCTNAQALWRKPQTNRTVRTERRENKTPKNKKKRPLPQSPLPLSGKGRGEAQKHASAGEELGSDRRGGSGAWGRETAQQHLRGCRSRRRREGRGFSTRCRRRTKTVPNIPFPRRQTLRATDAKKHLETSRVSLKNVPVFRHNQGTIFQNLACFFLGFLPP